MGYIDSSGAYHSGTPKMVDITPQATSVWKQSDHDRQRQDHKADLVKPYLPSGDPNPEFIELYPVAIEGGMAGGTMNNNMNGNTNMQQGGNDLQTLIDAMRAQSILAPSMAGDSGATSFMSQMAPMLQKNNLLLQ